MRYYISIVTKIFSGVLFCAFLCSCIHKEIIDTNEEKIDINGPYWYEDVEMISNLRYDCDENGLIQFYWDEVEDYTNRISSVEVIIKDGNNIITEKITESITEWKYKMPKSGEKYSFEFCPISNENVGGRSYSCSCMYIEHIQQMKFPRIEITTLNAELPTCQAVYPPEGAWGISITDNEYVKCNIEIYGEDNTLTYCTSSNFNDAKIRVRGNTSALNDKKPLKIKLDNEEDLLKDINLENGTTESDNWVLLKSGFSLNHIVGSTVSELLQMDYTPRYQYVILTVNGDYRGIYILCESIEEKIGKCDIEDDGYIVELDSYWWNEEVYFESPLNVGRGVKYTFKFPDEIKSDSIEYNYIKEYVTNFENALILGNEYTNYLDMESMAKWTLAHDILCAQDSGGSNIYFTKKDSSNESLLKMGPLWDFDSIMWKTDIDSNIRGESWFCLMYLANKETFLTNYRELSNNTLDLVTDTVMAEINNIDYDIYSDLLVYEEVRYNIDYTGIIEKNNAIELYLNERIDFLKGRY